MKIKRPPKKTPSSNAHIASLIVSLSSSAEEQLPALLQPVIDQGWSWPRTDLQHWIVALNRFDEILGRIVSDYDLSSLDHAQTNAFTPRTKEVLLAILAFEKQLLENSTNRKIFASFDRLNDLLHTSDLTVLLATLRLGLRPAQQFSLTNNGTSSFGIAEKRLLSLAQGWATREAGLEMVDLAQEDVVIPSELDELNWQFYKRIPPPSPRSKGKEVEMQVEPPAPSTSAGPPQTPARRSTFSTGAALATPVPQTPATPAAGAQASSYFPPVAEGLTTVSLGNVRLNPKSAVDVLMDAVEAHSIPEPDRLDLLQKIRIAKSLHSTEARRTMLQIRLLAIAVFAHTVTESTAQSKLFLFEPELIPQLAELVHPDRNVPIEIQAAALYALDALAKFKGRLAEVASSLNASVSHGILMYVLRTTVADLAGEKAKSTVEFVDALFNLLTFFHTNSQIGNMIVGAGVVSTLVDFVKNQRRDRVSAITKAVVFLDGLMYGYTSAFNNFIAAGGLSVFVDRTKLEIDAAVEQYAAQVAGATEDSPTGALGFEQAGLIKGLLRALQRLMQTAGTTEGLRNLIDSPLLSSVKTIVQNRYVFGSQVLGLAINMTATFVHNEPTCLTTIQEAKVPEALYDSIEGSIPASIDVLQAIPNAIGALCLNPQGLAQFNERKIVQTYFAIFASEKHAKVLAERDNATMIGASIDELTRHHPTLREPVYKAIYSAFEQIKAQGESFKPDSNDGYGLQLNKADLTDAEPSTAPEPSSSSAALNLGSADVVMGDVALANATAKLAEEVKENAVQSSIDVLGRFLEGMFQSITHCKEFIKLDPVPLLLDLLALPCAPAVNPASAAFSAISSLFRIMSEVKQTEFVDAVLVRCRTCLDKTAWFWDAPPEVESKLAAWLEPTPESLAQEDAKFRDVTVLLSYVAMLSDLYSNLAYTHGKTATAALVVFESPENEATLRKLGKLYRSCVWQDSALKPRTGGPPTDLASVVGKLVEGAAPQGLSASDAPAAAASASDAATGAGSSATSSSAATKSINFKTVDDVVTNIPLNIVPLFQSIIKLLVHRRSSDETHKKAAGAVAKSMANLMKDNLAWNETTDLNLSLSCSTLLISNTCAFLFDERSNFTGLHTLLLSEFVKVDGLTQLLALYAKYQDVASELLEGEAPQNGVGHVVHLFGGLKISLDYLQRLSSHKTILEAPQTAVLIGRTRDKASVDYFDPHALLVKIRAAVLPVITKTWTVNWLRKSPPNLVRAIVATFANILKAEGETSADPTAGLGQTLGTGLDGGFADLLLGGGGAERPRGLGALLGALGGGGPGADFLGGAPGGIPAPRQPFQLDQTRVDTLIDMGFPRRAVEQALTRCRNNIAVATEYLLQHPDVVGEARAAEEAAPAAAEPQAEQPAADAQPAPAAEGAVAEGPAVPAPGTDVEMGEGVAAPAEVTPATEADETASMAGLEESEPQAPVPKVNVEEREAIVKAILDELNLQRDQIKPHFLAQALSLAEDYGDLVFDIKAVFALLTAPAEEGGERKPPSLEPILAELRKDGPTDQAVATRLRVIALIAVDATFKDSIQSARLELMQVLVRFADKYNASTPAADGRPKWLASLMLVADSLFSLAEAPIAIDILAEGHSFPANDVPQGPEWAEEKQKFFTLAIDVLAKGVSTREVFISTLRLVLVLTRTESLAQDFLAKDGLKLLYASFSTERPETAGCRSYVVMILRHLIEESAILSKTMEREIEAWFSQSRGGAKVADVTGFLRGASSLALRNVPQFLLAAEKTLKLVQADSSGHYHVALQRDPHSSDKAKPAEAEILSPFAVEGVDKPATGDAQMDDLAAREKKAPIVPNLTPAPQGVELAVHFLMQEVIDASKGAMGPVEQVKVVQDEAQEGAQKAVEKWEVPADTPMGDFYQTAFGLSCLAEMLSAYSACKAAFLTFSTRKHSPKEPTGGVIPPKSRSSFLYFLLSDIIPVGSVTNPIEFEARRRVTLSHWASLVIVSLCHDAESNSSTAHDKDHQHEIASVRKAVLDGVAKAFKEATANVAGESTDVRYGRLYALSDLCYRLLAAKALPTMPKGTEDAPIQMAKLMLEKNFAAILTNALAEVDLNFPQVNNLINSILRPLEQLTKVVTKVGRAKNAPAGGVARRGAAESSEESEETASDEFDEGEPSTEEEEEQAPDLYRNSALGMYEGELEPQDSYMDDGEEEFGEDEMMEEEDYEEGLPAGSDVSDMSDSDEDGDEQHMDEDEIEEILEAEGDTGTSDEDDPSTDELDTDDEDAILDVDVDDDEQAEIDEMLQAEGEGDWEDDEDGYDEDEGDDVLDLADGPLGALVGGPGGAGRAGGGEGGAAAEGFEQAASGLVVADGEDGDEEESFTDEEEAYLQGELEFDEDPIETEELEAEYQRQMGIRTGGRTSRLLDGGVMMAGVSSGGDSLFDRTPRGASATQSAQHPLLVDAPASDSQTDIPRGGRRGSHGGQTREYDEWARSVEQMIGTGAVQALQDLLGQQGLPAITNPNQVHLSITRGPDGAVSMLVDPTGMQAHPTGAPREGGRLGATEVMNVISGHPAHAGGRGSRSQAPRSTARQLADRLNASADFLPVSTVQRWQEEGRVLQSSLLVNERTARLGNHLINALHPPARAAAKEAKEKANKEREEAQRKAEELAREVAAKEEQDAAAQAEAPAEASTSAATPQPPAVNASAPAPVPVEDPNDPEAIVRNMARALAIETGASTPVPQAQPAPAAAQPALDLSDFAAAEDYEVEMGDDSVDESGDDDDDEGDYDEEIVEMDSDDELPALDRAQGADQPAEAAAPGGERVMITIHGREHDITDTGIDPTFLEALPDDMREEVLSQHFREAERAQRAQQPPAQAQAAPSSINAEFLDALPPELREEVLRQEAAEQRRAERQRRIDEAAVAPAPAAGEAPAAEAVAADLRRTRDQAGETGTARVVRAAWEDGGNEMDLLRFLRSIGTQTRDRLMTEIQMDRTDGLPQDLLAGIEELVRNGRRLPGNRIGIGLGPRDVASPHLGRSAGGRKGAPHREAIQLLDKSGLATLVRLLFFPQPLRKGVLQKVLVHVCENSRTRTDLILLLLGILQDGTRDVSAVDKSFSAMSIRASKALVQQQKETPKRKMPATPAAAETPGTAGGTLPHFPGESVPNLIAQRALEALHALVQANELSSVFFLSEQDVPLAPGPGKRSAKKGKGKEKHTSATYPLIVLLGLLDRPSLLKTQTMMDGLTSLLAAITKTLAVLQKKKGDDGAAIVLDATAPALPAERSPTDAAAQAEGATAEAGGSTELNKDKEDAPARMGVDILLESPPMLPPSALRQVVNILDAGECSSRTFQQTLSLIQNLSYLPEAREIISTELKARAQLISQLLKPDLDELLAAIQSNEPVRGATLAKFSPASALQAKLLRMLKTIDWLHSTPKKGASPAQAAAAAVSGAATPSVTDNAQLTAEEQKVSDIFASFSFEPVFQGLSACLSAVADQTENLNIATILLPLIEVVLVVCKHVHVGARKDGQGGASVPPTPALESASGASPFEAGSAGAIEAAFVHFTTEHKTILNKLIRANPGLMSGSFAILVRNSSMLEFANKRTFFFSRLHDRSQRARHYGNLQVNVRRQHVFEDSFRTLQGKGGDEIKYGKLNIKFFGEEGVDAGGVTREWFSSLARQMFNPDYALFQPQAADSLTYQPNKSSGIANEEHLLFFRFVGRIIGKALHDQRILEAYFSRSVYKHMLGNAVDHKDLESIDPDYYKSLVWMLENDIDGVLDLTMSVERDEFGVVEIVDLVPNGRNVEVTNANKAEYVRLIAENRLTTEIKDQIGALCKGLYEVVPRDLLQIFSEKELELLISGLPEIDVDEWRANTDLHNFSSTDPVIGYFWRAVRSFSHEERAKLLQFVSGSSRVPLEGFGSLQGMSGVTKFSIHNAGAVASLPTAHTCFNQLDLASGYESYEALRAALLTSITEGANSFGFA